MATLAEVEAALRAADAAGETEDAARLAAEYVRLKGVGSSPPKAAAAPGRAAGAADRGGSTSGGDSPAVRALDAAAPGLAVTAGAFAKIPAGVADLAAMGVGALERKAGILDPNLEIPSLTAEVDDWVDDVSGKKIPRDSVLRGAYEGAITVPLSGAKTAARIVPATVAGGAAGATATAVANLLSDPQTSPWLRVPLITAAAMLAGKAAGSLPYLNGLSKESTLAAKPVQQASRGVSREDWRAGKAAHAEGMALGENLLPGQALPVDSAGWRKLQGALLNARGDKADSFVSRVAGQPERVRALVEKLKNIGGQTPRDDAELAAAASKYFQEAEAARPKAINAATAADYNNPLNSSIKFSPKLERGVADGFVTLLEKHKGSIEVTKGLTQARDAILELLRKGDVTPATLAERLQSVKNALPVYDEIPGTANHVRGVVTKAVAPLEELIGKVAPPLARAKATQAELRAALPGEFDDTVRLANRGGDPKTYLNDLEKRSAMVEALAKQSVVIDGKPVVTANPLAAKEVLQRQINRGVQDAVAFDNTSGVQPRQGPIKLANDLLGQSKGDAGIAGQALQKNLEGVLFQGAQNPTLAAEGFNRILRVARNASREPGFAPAEAAKVAEPAMRLVWGSLAQQTSETGRQLSGIGKGLRANALIDLLARPDVMARLEYLAQMPPDRVTRAVVLATFPQLFDNSPLPAEGAKK